MGNKMLRVEWFDKAGWFSDEDEAFPATDNYGYITTTSTRYELVGTMNKGQFAGENLLLVFTGTNFEYDFRSDGTLNWTDGNVTRWQYFVDGELYLEMRFDPATSNEDVFDTYIYRAQRGFEYFGNNSDNFLEGGNGADSIHGRKGSDKIVGLGGSDSLYGGSGYDTLDGGTSADVMSGGRDRDYGTKH